MTTTTSNSGKGLAKQGKKVLLIDAQGSLTASLGYNDDPPFPGKADGGHHQPGRVCKTAFSDDERNLIVNYAFKLNDMEKTRELAEHIYSGKYVPDYFGGKS